ncbi:hypothetical protein I312_101301 [Cryptococcus bacillisporus CA1280]|uniref:uncharacterized protein n=1 Tax=Cryptococcus bacillisporus CA1280 TaxID=1296109 RepID=UPI003366CD82
MQSWFDEQPGMKENPFLHLEGLDPNRDTPIETLHTFLLGIVKYCWRLVHIGWNAKDPRIDKFIARLTSLPNDGLGYVTWSAKYMYTYRNALNGKQFRILSQLLPFAVHGLVHCRIGNSAPGTVRALPGILQGGEDKQYSVVARSGDVCLMDSCVLARMVDHAKNKMIQSLKSRDRTSSSYFRRCTAVWPVVAWKMGRGWRSRNERRR